MTRLAAISDIHGNLAALEAVLEDIERQGKPDLYWVLGDLAAFCPWPSETIERLRALPNASFLRGNTDRYLTTGQRPTLPKATSQEEWTTVPARLEERDASFRWSTAQLSFEDYVFLSELPLQLETEIPGYGSIAAVHANAKDDETFLTPDMSEDDLESYFSDIDAGLVLYGHTHRPVERTVRGRRIVNDGSVGLPLDGDPRPAYALLDFEAGECQVTPRRVEYDREQVITELERIYHPARAWVQSILKTATP